MAKQTFSYDANTLTDGLITIPLTNGLPTIAVYFDLGYQTFTATVDDIDNPTTITINIGINPTTKTKVIFT